VSASAQDTGRRTQELVAALDKTKQKSKEKRGIKIEVYVDIKNEAVIKADPSDYSGRYADELNMHKLDLTVTADGRATGTGSDYSDEGRSGSFPLRDARIDGALLTATKVYYDGSTQKLEAVFAKRTVRSGENEKNATSAGSEFGLGYLEAYGQSTSRVFLTKN